MTKKQKNMVARILITSVLTVLLYFIPLGNPFPKALFYLIPYLLIGYDVLKRAAVNISHGQVFDENFLMSVATVGAYVLAVLSTGEYTEAVAVLLFYQIGELFQGIAVGKSRKNIAELMDIRPDYANVEEDGQLVQVDPDEVEIGTRIIVQPGEKIPIDGIVLEGSSSLDTSSLTGESVPRSVVPGSKVMSGCINETGVLAIQTTHEFGESTASRILDLVENASSNKSRSEDFISKFARFYTPIVCYCALALAVLPPLFLLLTGNSANFGTWIYRALTFLVISCPCALVISIPLTFFAGLGGASHEGILIKGSNYLETLSQVKTVVMDKTGTLTKGVFSVSGIHHSSMEKDALLDLAAHAECASSHPIAKSIQTAYGKKVDRSRVTDIEEISGHGICATVDGKKVYAGNEKLMARIPVACHSCHETGTIVHIAVDEDYQGHLVISDQIKEHARQAVADLKRSGVDRIVMLTGDAHQVAEDVASSLGITEVFSELLPQDKVAKVEQLLTSGSGKLAFVGDGVNDAPVLSRADIGVAMGALGSDAAIEAADVVLMDDDPVKIGKSIRIARKCMRIVYQNIVFAIGVKVLCLLLSAFGVANMWLAIFADVGVMIIAVLNAIRALMVKNA